MIISGLIAKCRARGNHTIYNYTLETKRVRYRILTNRDKFVNYPILAIDWINLIWAIIGLIMDKALGVSSTGHGAITNCMRDYGMNTCLMVQVLLTLSFV